MNPNEPADKLTKRELLAAMAMQSMLSNPGIIDQYPSEQSKIFKESVKSADALLAELSATEFCEWTPSDVMEHSTKCGFETTIGLSPERKFCPYCDKRIKEVR